MPGGGGRAAAGRPRSLRSARRSAHPEQQQRGPAGSRPYGGVKPETPKRNTPSPGTLCSARPAAPREAAAGTEEARARAQRGGGGGGAAARRSTAGPASRRAPATMNFLLTWIHWGLAALLYLQSAEVSGGTGAFVPRVAEGEGRRTAENTFPPPFFLFFFFLPVPLLSFPPTCSVRCGRARVGARSTDTCAGVCVRCCSAGTALPGAPRGRARCPRTGARPAGGSRRRRGAAVGGARGREYSAPLPSCISLGSPDIAKGCFGDICLGSRLGFVPPSGVQNALLEKQIRDQRGQNGSRISSRLGKKKIKMWISCTEITKPRIFLFLFSYFYLIVILKELETNSSSFPLFKVKRRAACFANLSYKSVF